MSPGHVLLEVARSLREAGYMFWETLWALVLGFGLSGAVQAFVPRDKLQARIGNHRPLAVARASVYGMASSSCSYAASAMARSLFQKGADFVASMVFMFASTNLVIELGIVLAVLIGWQFAAAEFVGGAIMIVLLSTAGALWLRGSRIEHARGVADRDNASSSQGHGEVPGPADRQRFRTAGGWADAAGYTMADLTMLRREMLIGYLVAGFLAVLVPVHVWSDIFLDHHGSLTTVENVVVGPFIAVVSFVCSIGNVPLAAALWKGGISFGGVVSFIFADLISFPLLLIYRKFYSGRVALRMLLVFWAVISLAGLAVQAIFSPLGLVPSRRSGRILAEHFSWDYTTWMNLVFLVAFAGLYWLYRNRERFGGAEGLAIDPVCGMQVERATAPARAASGSTVYFFCSERCRDRFTAQQKEGEVNSPR